VTAASSEKAILMGMAWVKVPPENHPVFRAALPKDKRVEVQPMFGGLAAKVNGHIFAGLFGRSTMLWLPEPMRAEALALDGAGPFDPMGDGRKSDKVMLPEALMEEPEELASWIGKAFKAAAKLPPKSPKKPTAAKKKPKKA
jgi:TfoX-like protein